MMRGNYKIVKFQKTEVYYEVQTEYGHKPIHRFTDGNAPILEAIDPPRPLTSTEFAMLRHVLSNKDDDNNAK